MGEIRNELDALRACYEVFIKRLQEECELMIHHVEATSRKMSCMCVESRQGGYKSVPTLEGINIVYSTPDYMALGIEARAEGLKKEIYALAEKYCAEKYQEKIINTSYVRFLHPEMPGYNGYYLWLG